MEESKSVRSRQESMDISEDLDLTDLDHCILCYNEMKQYVVGVCNHKNVCITCALRVRLIMEDNKCQICRTELPEIFVTENKDRTWQDFLDMKRERKSGVFRDKEDKNIYYESKQCTFAGMNLRALQCPMYGCNSKQMFPNIESLRRHLESQH
jgi:hypothetical protein